MKYHLAQINIARIKGENILDPVMSEFVENLDAMNHLAENSEGFVWRLKDEDNNATLINPMADNRIIINISVWESVSALKDYAFKSIHGQFVKRRKEWFLPYEKAYMALWWVPEGSHPGIEESLLRLEFLQENGPTVRAFDFKTLFDPPQS